MDKIVRIGLAGLGTVGAGFLGVLSSNAEWIAHRLGRKLEVTAVLVRDLNKQRGATLSPRTRLTTVAADLTNDPEIDIVVELMGGTGAAYDLVKSALSNGKSVVTANKALLAERGPELFALAEKKGVGLYYEAAVAGGVPIVQTLKESLAGNRILQLIGILNGTCNYILSEMTAKGLDFSVALAEAQRLGFAEADPAMDIEGTDAAQKLILLIRLAFGKLYPMDKLDVTGIKNVGAVDIACARDFGYRIKLLAQVREIEGNLLASVCPMLIREEHILSTVGGPFNAILLEGDAVGEVMLYGRGAGGSPTGSAVLADVMALARNCACPNNTGFVGGKLPKAALVDPAATRMRHYLRLNVQDEPGVLAVVGKIMAERGVSLAQVVQKVNPGVPGVPVVFLTHQANGRDIEAVLRKIDAQKFITAPTAHYPIFEG